MSDTPETDSELHGIKAICKDEYMLDTMAEFARKLERERDGAREESLEQARLLGISGERECRLIAERDEARKEILGWENKWKAAVEMAALAENERDRLRDRLTNTEDQLDYALICLRRHEGRLIEKEP
jgi:hypothetical protein